MKKSFSKSYTAFVKVPAGETKVYFPLIHTLRDKTIKFIATTNYNAYNLFITLFEKKSQQEFFKRVGANLLHFGESPILINRKIDLSYSFFTLEPDNSDREIPFTFFFEDERKTLSLKQPANDEVYTTEIVITGKRTFFEDDKYLTGKFIRGIVFSRLNYSPQGNDTIDNSFSKYLTLIRGNQEIFTKLPLRYLEQSEYNNPLLLNNIQFDVKQSYIDIPDLEPSMVGKSIVLTFIL